MPSSFEFTSLLEVFIETASNPRTADRYVLECGQDTWTYATLETVSSAMARELEETTGFCPKVAAVGENHPYVFALMLAVWKVGGIFIPIDAHVPPALLDGMIDVVKPTCVYLAASDNSNTSRASGFNVQVRVFDAEHSTIPALNQRYGQNGIARAGRWRPKSDATCLYLFTSSASSRKNLKAVPLTHKFILTNCQSKLAWWRHMQPHKDLDGTRVLGWAPWSHVLSHMQDIGTATILTAGCYVFASVPSSYLPQVEPTDLTSKVVSGIVNKNVTALATLPFVLSGLRAACESGLPEAQALLGALRSMTMLECGGAVLDLSVANWAERNDIPLVVGVGMTETGGAIFAGRAKEAFSGFSPQNLIPDAQLSLIGGDSSHEGELVVKSKLLPSGYIDYDDGSFSVDEEGWVTFKTGDRYRIDESRFTWLGRITDYIQMTSGESLDPRPLEESLRSFEFISNACIIGDTFLQGASTTVCAIIELTDAQSLDARAAKIKVAQVLAPINADLPPALRISMSSVLILNEYQKIPRTKKGEVFRKQIEDMFGAAIAMVQRSATHFERNFEQVEDELTSIVGKVLGISDMDMLTSMTFAELGMTSLLAVKLATKLNDYLAGRVVLPINICYIHADVLSLTTALRNSLSTTSVPEPMVDTSVNTKEEVVIVGKAFQTARGNPRR
ncbi:Hispidin synthase [Mycena venus]|uniref:Hispidin synthase n=1 Tax=Mycena venus TaxID=2733690 RepID=A0A8H6U3J0_9AGAR|nr:Hispidin synthase [Mycena venus]